MAEWLRRWTANPLGSARAGSNPVNIVLLAVAQLAERPIVVVNKIRMVPGSNPGGEIIFLIFNF